MIFGIIVCFVMAVFATVLGYVQHIVGVPMLGLIFGILLANTMPAAFLEKSQKGAAFSSKRLLRLGIILAGGTLNFKAIMNVGSRALPLVVGAILVAFIAAYLIGKAMGVSVNTRLLVGGGTSICGGTAIATLSAVIEAKEDETAYAMTSIFLFDILAALIWPYVAFGLSFTPDQFGVLAGIAINDVSSVTAAGQSFDTLMGAGAFNAAGVSGGDLAMIVKLTRVAMLVIVAIVMTIIHQVHTQKGTSEGSTQGMVKNVVQAFPFYVLGFLVLAAINTAVDFTTCQLGSLKLSGLLSYTYKFLFAMALVGVGYKIKLKELFTEGIKPLILGGCTWAAVSVIGLLYSMFFV